MLAGPPDVRRDDPADDVDRRALEGQRRDQLAAQQLQRAALDGGVEVGAVRRSGGRRRSGSARRGPRSAGRAPRSPARRRRARRWRRRGCAGGAPALWLSQRSCRPSVLPAMGVRVSAGPAHVRESPGTRGLLHFSADDLSPGSARLARDSAPRAAGLASRSSSRAATVSSAHDRLVPMNPVGPRLAQPTTYTPGPHPAAVRGAAGVHSWPIALTTRSASTTPPSARRTPDARSVPRTSATGAWKRSTIRGRPGRGVRRDRSASSRARTPPPDGGSPVEQDVDLAEAGQPDQLGRGERRVLGPTAAEHAPPRRRRPAARSSSRAMSSATLPAPTTTARRPDRDGRARSRVLRMAVRPPGQDGGADHAGQVCPGTPEDRGRCWTPWRGRPRRTHARARPR